MVIINIEVWYSSREQQSSSRAAAEQFFVQQIYIFISYIWFWLCSTLLLTQGTVDVFEVVPDVQIEGTRFSENSRDWVTV